jgi:murein DD-endopeptidase MepM/ murein hydrolase activator NlpD
VRHKNNGFPASYKRQVMYDYNARLKRSYGRDRSRQRRRIFSFSIIFFIAVAAAFGLSRVPLDMAATDENIGQSISLELPLADPPPRPDSRTVSTDRIPFEPQTIAPGQTAESSATTKQNDQASDWTKVVVTPGDNLSLIFGRYGFSKKDLHRMLKIKPAAKNLRRIKPGQAIMVKADENGRVLGMVQELDYRRSLHVRFQDDSYSASVVEVEPEIRYSSVLAKIKQSLFLDGQAAGLADKTIMELSDIFGWDIDFVLDVRSGDQFSVVYEEIFKDGKKVKNGKILAAEFVNRGKKLRAVYYSHTDGPAGYYSDTGQTMRKAFLRAPVDFTRISSRFNLRRRHPVLNTIRAHKGVDYAAPHGTPVRATADGKITHAGNKGGYGRTVVIQHGESYSTLFAHMSRFARGIKRGAKIRQGQTIGYVGKTGLATGPHLHYEFRVNGVHRNPLKIALPKALPIDAKYIADFRTKAAPLLAQLDELDNAAKSDKLVAGIEPEFGQASSGSTPSKTQ